MKVEIVTVIQKHKNVGEINEYCCEELKNLYINSIIH